MTKRILPLLAGLLISAPAAAQQTPSPRDSVIPLDAIVAIVGGKIITRYDVQERLIQYVAQLREGGQPMPTAEALYPVVERIVGSMVDEEIILAKSTELAVELTDAEVTDAIERRIKEIQGRFATEQEFRQALAGAGYGTVEEYRRILREQYRRDALIRMTTRQLREEGKMAPITVSDAEVTREFETMRATLPRRPATISWRQLVISPSASAPAKARARAKAESLLVELKAGGDFERIAKRESMDAGSKESGGDLGWNRRGKLVPEFERVLFGPFALRPGELSPVIETSFGFHIIRVDRVQPAEVKARHILISPQIDSADVARTRELADSVAAQARRGVSMDSLARRHHDYGGGEDAGLIPELPRDSIPVQYQNAFADRAVGDVVAFEIPSRDNVKFVVAQIAAVSEGGEYTLGELRERVRRNLAEQGGARRFLDAQRREIYVVVHTDRARRAADALVAAARP